MNQKNIAKVISETIVPPHLWPHIPAISHLFQSLVKGLDPNLTVRIAKEDYDNRILIAILKISQPDGFAQSEQLPSE